MGCNLKDEVEAMLAVTSHRIWIRYPSELHKPLVSMPAVYLA